GAAWIGPEVLAFIAPASLMRDRKEPDGIVESNEVMWRIPLSLSVERKIANFSRYGEILRSFGQVLISHDVK
ncbi:MAG: hypothetical protein Q4P05_09140, partial [Actinomycetaceae bacterium]|nr:hypothetical protein [Actinomycetaceae bacterium]